MVLYLKMKIEVTHNPLALVLQISPQGELIEPVLRCEMHYEGGSHARDVWIKDMPDEWKAKANDLIKEAVKVLE